jgi:hypothetical protein
MGNVNHGGTLPDLAQKTDFYAVVDNSTVSNIVNADISANAAIAGSKLGTLNTIGSGAGVIPAANLPAVAPSFTTGMIILWSGSVATIPSGWYLCNGSNSTPDLRGRFVIAAQGDTGNTYDVGDTGNGSVVNHSHAAGTLTGGAHTHTYKIGTNDNTAGSIYASRQWAYASNDSLTTSSDGEVAVTGSTATDGGGTTNVAVFYALAYIMKS